jgi:hypothetical protein
VTEPDRDRAAGSPERFVTFTDAVGYWAFVLMFLTNPAQRLVKTRWRRRR